MMYTDPSDTAPNTVISTQAVPIERLPSRRRLISGARAVSARTTKPTMPTTASTLRVRIRPEPNQVSRCPSSSTTVSEDRPVAISAIPAQSP